MHLWVALNIVCASKNLPVDYFPTHVFTCSCKYASFAWYTSCCSEPTTLILIHWTQLIWLTAKSSIRQHHVLERPRITCIDAASASGAPLLCLLGSMYIAVRLGQSHRLYPFGSICFFYRIMNISVLIK